jgi:hypothetical protein
MRTYRWLALLAVLLAESRADVAVPPAGRLARIRRGQLGALVDPKRGVTEIVYTTDVASEEPAPKKATHRCGKKLEAWLDKELRPIVTRAFESEGAKCDGDVCSGPNERTEEWGTQTTLHFKQGRLRAVVVTSQYMSETEFDRVLAFIDRELRRANGATCP